MPFGRRGFLKLFGTGAVAVAASRVLPPLPVLPKMEEIVPPAFEPVAQMLGVERLTDYWSVVSLDAERNRHDAFWYVDEEGRDRQGWLLPPHYTVRAERGGKDEEWWHAITRGQTVPVQLALPHGLYQFDAHPVGYDLSFGFDQPVKSELEIMSVGEIARLPLPREMQPYTLGTVQERG